MSAWSRRALVAGLAGVPALSAGAYGQEAWPSGPIRIVVPFAPGGSTDAVARLAAPGLQQGFGAPIVVENRSGAAGSLGTDVVAKARPDGHTWLLTFDSHAVMPALVPHLPFDLHRDLAPVTLIGGAPYVVACKPDKPYRAIADVVAAARARPEGVSFASTGNGTLGHLAMVLLAQRAGVRLQHLPYRGGGLAVNDAVAGHVDMVIGSAALLAPQVTAGTLRPLLQLGAERLPAFADVPTAEESGFPGLQAEAWWGVFAPARTPAPVIARFHEALKAAFRDQRIARQMTEAQQARLVLAGPDEFGRFLDREVETWGKVVRENGIQAD
jgi:tripartite-type tricarboxylate transporter receptor subunit TctC